MNVSPVDSEIPWELDLITDNLALEFVEELSLNFEVNPSFQIIFDRALAAGEFIRDRVIVKIADNDGKTYFVYFAFATKSDMTIVNLPFGGVLETGNHKSQSW